MDRIVDIKSNKILYPLQKSLGLFIHLVILLLKPICPKSLKGRLEELEGNSVVLNVLGLSFFNALGGVIVMITNIKVANVLGASLYGLYAYYLAIGEVGSNFVRYGRHKTMTRDLIQNPSVFDSLVSNTFVLSLMNLGLFCLGVWALSTPLEIDLSISAWLLIISCCIGSIEFQPVYESMHLMSWHACYHLIQKILFFIGVWAGILSFSIPSLAYISIISFVSWFVIFAIQYWEIIITLKVKYKGNVSLSSIWGLYKSNFLIALSCMTGVAFGPILQLILKNYCDTQAVGVYAAGMQIFIICQFLLNQIARVGNPMMAEAGKVTCTIQRRKRFVIKYTAIMVLTSLPFLFPLILFPQFITNLLYSAEYVELGRQLPWFGFYLLAFGIGVVFTQFLISMRKDKLYFSIYIFGAILTVLSALVLIPRMGLTGAVISFCLPHSLSCIGYCLFSIKFLKNENS